MAGISQDPVRLNDAASIGASVTDQVVSKDIKVTSMDSLNFRLDIVVSNVVVGGGITVQLAQAIGGQIINLSSANASKSITTDGVVSIRLNKETAADIVDMPISKQLVLRITTGAGSSLDIDQIIHERKS